MSDTDPEESLQCNSSGCDNEVKYEVLEIPYGAKPKHGSVITRRCEFCKGIMIEGSQLYGPGIGIKWNER